MKVLWLVPVIALAGVGCGPKYYWDHYMNNDIVKVAVLPPFDNTSEPDEEDIGTVRNLVWEHMKGRGYDVIPQETVGNYYRSKGYNIPQEIMQTPREKICSELGVQALVFTGIEFWGKRVMGIVNYIGVEMEFALVDAEGKDVWREKDRGKAGKESGGLNRDSIIASVFGTLIDSAGNYAPEAIANAFSTLGHAGWDPKIRPPAPAPAPAPSPSPSPK